MGIVRLNLDVLKTLKGPSIIELAQRLLDLDGVRSVNVKVNEIDVETMTLTVTIEGTNIDFEAVKRTLESMDAVVHSIDEVLANKD